MRFEGVDVLKRVHFFEFDNTEQFLLFINDDRWLENTTGEFVQIQQMVSFREYVPQSEPVGVSV